MIFFFLSFAINIFRPSNPNKHNFRALDSSQDAYNFYAQKDPLTETLPSSVPLEQPPIAPMVAEILRGTPLQNTFGRPYESTAGVPQQTGHSFPMTTSQDAYRSTGLTAAQHA